MVNVTERDPLDTRRRIFEEYRKVQAHITAHPESWRSMAFRAHQKMCTVMRDAFIDYPEFEFWFSRFARGNFELDYDRSSDPEVRRQVTKQNQIRSYDSSNEFLRLLLRDVCKDVRAHVDNWDLRVDEISYFGSLDCHADGGILLGGLRK
ncbi:hypothetical protein CRE_11453 [Caenorhabditis remanei]|uniref:Mos1 transposase HTH domain-containing protein n=1 Tax=Caenorhabditis remanei TaxID=31234 RepID=E3NBE0_CAERE|nr:hypothetical protein CRE_11453 [Caenorhabditis remanei]